MLPCQIWKSINRLSFFENAILLETRSRSQGKPIQSSNTQEDHDTLCEPVLSRQTIQCLLDDFALLVSGAGGKDNVCAVCLEVNEQHKDLVLRVARNSVHTMATLPLRYYGRGCSLRPSLHRGGTQDVAPGDGNCLKESPSSIFPFYLYWTAVSLI